MFNIKGAQANVIRKTETIAACDGNIQSAKNIESVAYKKAIGSKFKGFCSAD
jgi:hypothetical protein